MTTSGANAHSLATLPNGHLPEDTRASVGFDMFISHERHCAGYSVVSILLRHDWFGGGSVISHP